jgi:hypothetical protein
MSQVSVTLVRADTNQEFDVELPDDANIAELLPALVKELGLPLTGPDGNQVAYELSNKRTGREYKEGTTLGGEGTKTGDSLLLTSTFVAGGRLNCRPEAKPLDLRTLPAEKAARALHAWARERSSDLGQNPDIEVSLLTPEKSAELGYGKVWRVMWEAGPHDWAVALTLGGSYLAGEGAYHDAAGNYRKPEVILTGSRLWTAEPHYGFDVGFSS